MNKFVDESDEGVSFDHTGESEEYVGATKHGGVRTVHKYFDEGDRPVPERHAKIVRVYEYDSSGGLVHEEQRPYARQP